MSSTAQAIAPLRVEIPEASRGSILKYKADRGRVVFVLLAFAAHLAIWAFATPLVAALSILPLTLPVSVFVAPINHHHQHLDSFRSAPLNRAYELVLCATERGGALRVGAPSQPRPPSQLPAPTPAPAGRRVHLDAGRRPEDGAHRVHGRSAAAASERHLPGGPRASEGASQLAADEAAALGPARHRARAALYSPPSGLGP